MVHKWKPSRDRGRKCSICGKRGFKRWCVIRTGYAHPSCVLRTWLNSDASTNSCRNRVKTQRERSAKKQGHTKNTEYNSDDGIPDIEKTYSYHGQFSVWYETYPPRWDLFGRNLLAYDKVIEVKL